MGLHADLTGVRGGGGLGGDLALLNDVLVPVSWIVRRRSAAQQEAVDLTRAEGRARRAAERLGISDQAVSERLLKAGHTEEQIGRRAALSILRATMSA